MATYIRLTDYKSSNEKEQEFFNPENRYEAKQEDFSKIPASPIAYWVSDRVNEIFEKSQRLGNISVVRTGLQTGNNNRFTRQWYEVSSSIIGFNIQCREETKDGRFTWFPYNKGGEYRKWFGNGEVIVNWQYDGKEIIEYAIYLNSIKKASSRMGIANNSEYYFKSGITWSAISNKFGARYISGGLIFDTKGPTLFLNPDVRSEYLIGLMNSKIADYIFSIIAPTLDYNPGAVSKFPYIDKKSNDIINKSMQNINISKEEWDSRETSWDFTKNELIKHKSDTKIETAYTSYCNHWKEQHNTLHQNEEELNRLFIDIYELQDEIIADVELKDITILKKETEVIDGELVFQADEIMKQFISYGVGVMFGRYSLDSDGLLIANMGQE
ncbi:MAG: hypothetical protein KAI79_14100, partial [Bacteroidales bacterium]|nr:hypothetical protein [Bacteroidales bacterium]